MSVRMEITTKRQLSRIQPGDVVNYRKFRLGTKTRDGVVGICPKCGERGALGDAIYTAVHLVRFRGWHWSYGAHEEDCC